MRKEGRKEGRWEIEEGRIFMPREADSFHPSSTQINTDRSDGTFSFRYPGPRGATYESELARFCDFAEVSLTVSVRAAEQLDMSF